MCCDGLGVWSNLGVSISTAPTTTDLYVDFFVLPPDPRPGGIASRRIVVIACNPHEVCRLHALLVQMISKHRRAAVHAALGLVFSAQHVRLRGYTPWNYSCK